jgi:hypothetical protein
VTLKYFCFASSYFTQIERFSSYAGYGHTWRFAGDFAEKQPAERCVIVGIDASVNRGGLEVQVSKIVYWRVFLIFLAVFRGGIHARHLQVHRGTQSVRRTDVCDGRMGYCIVFVFFPVFRFIFASQERARLGATSTSKRCSKSSPLRQWAAM